MLVISSASICRLLCLKRLFRLTPRMISIVGASLKRVPQLRVDLAFCHDIYIFKFFLEVSIAERPFDHILWPEVCKSL